MKPTDFSTPFMRFILVGAFNTLLGYGMMLFLFNFAKFTYSTAYLLSYIIGFIVSYFLTRLFVFQSKQKKSMEFIKFIVAFIIAYGASYLVLHLCIEYKILPVNIAFLVGMLIYSLCFYLLNKYITFTQVKK